MEFERQNILDLIGKHQSKYSSCIITCFSFDFTFFEQRVMSVLRAANIRNVNVFVDNKYLDNALENSEGGEFQLHKTYSVNGIRARGVFHPKIMLLTGPKHGLLVIGSGNLTNSGFSTNDEVWGAFHMNSIDSQNTPIFADAWKYLQRFIDQTDGINAEKLFWIKQRSPWLNELEAASVIEKVKLNNDTYVSFLANTKSESIFTKLLSKLPEKKITELNIVSPYFDQKGTFVTDIVKELNIDKINCITDPLFGILPIGLDEETKAKTTFYSWKDCIEHGTHLSRLHAKILQFKYEDNSEYLVFGSANATTRAFGRKKSSASNEEVSLLIKHDSNVDYLNSLGIELDGVDPLILEDQKSKNSNRGDSIQTKGISIRIKHAEIKDNLLSLFLDKEGKLDATIVVLDRFSARISTSACIKDKKQRTELDIRVQANKVFIEEEGERISNFALIHDVGLQEKSNPDPKQAEINQMLEDLQENPEGGYFIQLLKHTDFNWVDADFESKSSKGYSTAKSRDVEEVKEYEKIDEDKFYSLSPVQSSQATLLKDSRIRISDVLSIISKGQAFVASDISESEEERLASEILDEQSGEGEEVKVKSEVTHEGESEKKSIHAYLKKAQKYYQSQLNEVIYEKSIRFSPQRELQLNDYSNMSVVLDLINIFSNRNFTTENSLFALYDVKGLHDEIKKLEKRYDLERMSKTSPDNPTIVYFKIQSQYLSALKEDAGNVKGLRLVAQEEYETIESHYNYFFTGEVNGQKGTGVLYYLSRILGSFLITSNAGQKEYSYQLVNDKINHYRKEIFERAVFLLMNNRWREKEEKYITLMLLDLLHFVCQEDWLDKSQTEVQDLLESFYRNSKKRADQFHSNLDTFLSILERYKKWKEVYLNDRSSIIELKEDLGYGSIIYNNRLGFSMIKQIKDDGLIIIKHGFEWDEMQKECVLRLKSNRPKYVVF